MSGYRNFNELLSKMSPERRTRIKNEADALHRDYVLARIRQRVDVRQAEVAPRLGVAQSTYAGC